jgi:hypothetical protein
MGKQFVKTVHGKNKLYFYLAEHSYVDGRAVQKIIRPLTPGQARLLSFREAGAYDTFSTVLRLPVSEALSGHPHEHTIQVRIWGQVESPKTLICPSRVTLEQAGQVPVAEFRLRIPATPQAVLSIAVTSSCSLDEPNKTNIEQDTQTDAVKTDVVSESSTRNEISEKSPQETSQSRKADITHARSLGTVGG